MHRLSFGFWFWKSLAATTKPSTKQKTAAPNPSGWKSLDWCTWSRCKCWSTLLSKFEANDRSIDRLDVYLQASIVATLTNKTKVRLFIGPRARRLLNLSSMHKETIPCHFLSLRNLQINYPWRWSSKTRRKVTSYKFGGLNDWLLPSWVDLYCMAMVSSNLTLFLVCTHRKWTFTKNIRRIELLSSRKSRNLPVQRSIPTILPQHHGRGRQQAEASSKHAGARTKSFASSNSTTS